MRKGLSKLDINRLFARYTDGEKIIDLAREVSCKPNTLTCAFIRAKLKKEFKGQYSHIPYDEVYRLHTKEGIPYKKLCVLYSIPYKTLRNNLRLRGYPSDKENYISVPLEKAFERYMNGEMIKDLAEEYKISAKALSERFRSVGYKKDLLIHKHNLPDIDMQVKELGSLKAVCDKQGLVYGSILRWYSNFNISPRGYQIKNHDFFNSIDTQAKAYFLGFIYADGYLCESGNFFRIKINVRDKYILDKLASLLVKGHKELPIWKEGKGTVCSLSISSKKLVEDLKKWGVTQAKAFNIKFPKELSEEMIPHFIRGYFDGDGYIYIPKVLGHGDSPKFSIASVSRQMLEEIRVCLLSVDIHSNVYPKYPRKNRRNWHTLHIGRRKELIKIRNYLYGNAEHDLFLTRKDIKFQTIE